MNENEMLAELLSLAAYDTDKVRGYWNILDEEQKIAAFSIYNAGWNYDALKCVEIAYERDYRLCFLQGKTVVITDR